MRGHCAIIIGLIGGALAAPRDVAVAQNPVRLPEVVSRAEPGARAMAGIVRDTGQFPLEGVEITIPKSQRRVYSRPDGSFRFDSLSKGTYQVRARKVGYAPQARDVRIDSLGGIGDFELLPIPRALPAVVSSAARLGLGGIVADTAFESLAGAEVRVMGRDMRAQTDSTGGFYLPVPSGSYMVSITKPRFKSRVLSVTIPSDSGRRITVSMQHASGNDGVGDAWILPDLATRMAWVTQMNTHLYTRERMQKMGIEWGYDAVVGGFVQSGGKGEPDGDCLAIVNGGPDAAPLNSFTIDEIEAVEVYGAPPPRTASVRPTKQRAANSRPSMAMNTAAASRQADIGNQTRRNCPRVFVWTR